MDGDGNNSNLSRTYARKSVPADILLVYTYVRTSILYTHYGEVKVCPCLPDIIRMFHSAVCPAKENYFPGIGANFIFLSMTFCTLFSWKFVGSIL